LDIKLNELDDIRMMISISDELAMIEELIVIFK